MTTKLRTRKRVMEQKSNNSNSSYITIVSDPKDKEDNTTITPRDIAIDLNYKLAHAQAKIDEQNEIISGLGNEIKKLKNANKQKDTVITKLENTIELLANKHHTTLKNTKTQTVGINSKDMLTQTDKLSISDSLVSEIPDEPENISSLQCSTTQKPDAVSCEKTLKQIATNEDGTARPSDFRPASGQIVEESVNVASQHTAQYSAPRILLLADSQGRGMAVRLATAFMGRFQVESIFKPNACLMQVISDAVNLTKNHTHADYVILLAVVVAQDVQAVEGKSVSLPCEVTPPGHDKVYMVFWFQYGSGIPIYSFDVRGKPISQARHWSAPEVFGSRAYFNTVSEPAQLVINDIRRHDEGVYRCRVDFRNAQTRSFRYNLTVIVPPEQPTILDKWGRQLNGTVGPHREGDDITLTCRTVGGHPEPVVRWLVNGLIVDDQYEYNAGDVIENRLVWPSISRQHLDALFTCQAVNTKLTEPKEAMVTLNLQLKPLTAQILNTASPLVAEKRYEVTCESAGSRPPAIITWYKGKRQLKRAKDEVRENVTISELNFVPSTEDDGKSITCRAENPDVNGLYMETSWKIDVVYPPIVSLQLGSTLNADDIKEGDDVYFECHVRANPQWRKLTWLHDGIVLNHNMSARIIRSNQSLVLQRVTRQSAGRYVCSVVNTEGETLSNELAFRVQYSPICRQDRIVVLGASRGENIDVVCEIEADPPAKTYRWKFNNSGETLDVDSERFAKTSNGSMSILRYTPVHEMDYGLLSCWASNSVGHQINPCVFQVVAAGKPFPVRNCSLSNQTSSSVEVLCVPGFDGGLSQYFLLELYSTNSAAPRYNMTSTKEPYFFLDNLEPDVTFRIAVFAVNAKGRSSGVVLEEVTFRDAEKRTASDGDLSISPLLGIVLGAAFTVIIIVMLIIIRVRRNQHQPEVNLEQKSIGGSTQHTLSSTKPLLRSASPRELSDERDPDVIPAKYGSPDGESDRQMINGPSTMPLSKMTSSCSYSQAGIAPPQWMSPAAAPVMDSLYHQYNNPVAMVGTFPRDSRPKDLRLGNGNSPSLQRAADLELNGLAIKERLMANRLPESCV